jgi:hypothetical protein
MKIAFVGAMAVIVIGIALFPTQAKLQREHEIELRQELRGMSAAIEKYKKHPQAHSEMLIRKP